MTRRSHIIDVSDIHLRDIRFYVGRRDGKRVDFSNLVSEFSWRDHVNTAGVEVDLGLVGPPRSVLATGGEGSTAIITAPLVDLESGQLVRQELWRGFFEEVTDFRSEGSVERTIVAYDLLHPFAQNEEDLVFSNRTLSEILISICRDFEVPRGDIVSTSRNLGQIIGRGESLWDVLQKARQKHFNLTGEAYRIFAAKGRVHMVRQGDQDFVWVYEDRWSLMSTRRNRSIADMINQVKIYGAFEEDDDKAPLESVQKNSRSQDRYGVRQRVSYTSGDNEDEIVSEAKQTLDLYSAPSEQLEITGWIVPNLRSGEQVRFRDREVGINRLYFAESIDAEWAADRSQLLANCKRDEIDPEILLDEVTVA